MEASCRKGHLNRVLKIELDLGEGGERVDVERSRAVRVFKAMFKAWGLEELKLAG